MKLEEVLFNLELKIFQQNVIDICFANKYRSNPVLYRCRVLTISLKSICDGGYYLVKLQTGSHFLVFFNNFACICKTAMAALKFRKQILFLRALYISS